MEEILNDYSNWLDQQGLIREETDEDRRSHHDLVAQFLAEREEES